MKEQVLNLFSFSSPLVALIWWFSLFAPVGLLLSAPCGRRFIAFCL